MKSSRKTVCTEAIKALYSDFDFSLLEDPGFKEDSVREELIAPLLTALGYKPRGNALLRKSVMVTHPWIQRGTRREPITNFPDYLASVKGRNAFVLDAKGPFEEIKSGANREQTFFYAIHPDINVRLYALCNGREFIAFDERNTSPVIYFHLSEIANFADELCNLLSPFSFDRSEIEPEIRQSEAFDYLHQKPPLEIKGVRKQAAKRHFGVHAYFTKQAWQVVQKHIETFSQPGDLVLDPFGGSGVTLVESLVLRRRAIQVDLNPLANFMVTELIRPVLPTEIASGFERVRKAFEAGRPKSRKETEVALKTYSYPKNVELMGNADVTYLHELFSPEQLANLALLRHIISKERDEAIRSQLMLAFSSSLNKYNLTFHYTKAGGGGDSSAFRYYRFRIAPDPGKMDIMKIFEEKTRRLMAAKNEILGTIPEVFLREATVRLGTATDLSFIEDESVDYIYTDPPYGAKIPYLDLSVFWNSWLNFKVSQREYKLEAIEGGEHEQTREDYADLLSLSLEQMFRKLKYDRWMSFVFAHKDPAYWHIIVEAAEKVGFEYAGAVPQKSGQSSFKKRQNPFTVLFGQLIIHFRKVRNPKAIMKVRLGNKIAEIVQQTVEGIIAKQQGATLEEINDELVIRGLELGFLDILSKEYRDLNAYLLENYNYDSSTLNFNLKPNTKFRSHIPLKVRVVYYLLSFMRRNLREGNDPTFDEIVLHIMPLLKNGVTPEEQTVLNVLEKIAYHVGEERWRLKAEQDRDLFSSIELA